MEQRLEEWLLLIDKGMIDSDQSGKHAGMCRLLKDHSTAESRGVGWKGDIGSVSGGWHQGAGLAL